MPSTLSLCRGLPAVPGVTVATDTTPRVLHKIDAELADLVKRRSNCTTLIARCMTEIAGIEAEADVLLDARLALLDDGR